MRLVGLDGNIVSQPIDIETASGLDVLTDVVNDTSPQLGGDLDVNSRSLITTSNGNIVLAPNGTGQTQITGGSTNAAPLNIQYSNDGALVGPQMNLTRISASPADNDVIGGIEFRGRDSAGNTDTYSGIRGMIGKPNSGAERGLILFQAMNDGSNETVMTMSRKGLFMNASNDIYFEGSTDDDVRTQLSVEDPTSNRLIRLPNLDGTLLIDESDSGLLKLQKADDGAAAGPEIVLERTSASPATDDLLGTLIFKGQDSAGNIDTYANIEGKIERTNSGSERGRMQFNIVANGSMETIATFNRNGLFFGAGNKIGLGGDTDNDFFTSIYPADPSQNNTITLPDASGTVLLSSGTSTPLTGDFDLGGNKIITSASNNNIQLDPHGTGKVVLTGPVDIEGVRTNSNSMFISTDMSSDLTDDLHNVIECQSDYTGSTIGSGTRQQSITFKFKDDAVDRQAGRFNCEFTSTDPSQNKMKLIAIDNASSSPTNGQLDVTPKRGSINVPFELPSYTVANLPTSGIGAGAMAFCTNDAGGAVPCFYDGSAWRRVTDRAVAST